MKIIVKPRKVYPSTKLFKHCPSCNQTKVNKEFYLSSRTYDGLAAYCKTCSQEKNREWRESNKEWLKKYEKEYWKNNRKKKSARNKAWRESLTPAQKDKYKKYWRKWYREHPDKYKEYASKPHAILLRAQYRNEHREYYKMKSRERYKNIDKEWWNEYHKQRRIRLQMKTTDLIIS